MKNPDFNTTEDKYSSKPLRVSGIILVALGAIWYAVGSFLEIENILLLNIHIPFLILGSIFLYRSRQLSTKILPADVHNIEAAVVYLRPFSEDESHIKKLLPWKFISSFTSEEEQLSKVFKDFGQFIAIENPSKSLPTPGADKIHIGDAEWQKFVLEIFQKAKLVVIRLGSSQGILWEITNAIDLLEPKQLLFIATKLKSDEYNELKKAIRENYDIELPPITEIQGRRIGNGSFIAFNENWEPKVLPWKIPYFKRGISSKRVYNHVLQPIFEKFQVPWKPTKNNIWLVVATGLLSSFFLILLITVGKVIFQPDNIDPFEPSDTINHENRPSYSFETNRDSLTYAFEGISFDYLSNWEVVKENIIEDYSYQISCLKKGYYYNESNGFLILVVKKEIDPREGIKIVVEDFEDNPDIENFNETPLNAIQYLGYDAVSCDCDYEEYGTKVFVRLVTFKVNERSFLIKKFAKRIEGFDTEFTIIEQSIKFE